MSGTLMLVGNPAKRRKARSAKQRANDKRLGAMARGRGRPRKARAATRRRASTRVVAVAAPRRRRSTVRRSVRRYASRANAGYRLGGIVPMVKNAGAGAAGAVAVDIAFGLVQTYLPASFQSQTDASGSPNYMYYLAKSGTAIGIGMLGKKVLGKYAPALVMGSLIVTFHQLLRGFVQGTGMNIPLGAALMPGRQIPPLPISQALRGGVGRVGYYPQRAGVGAYVSAGSREMMMR